MEKEALPALITFALVDLTILISALVAWLRPRRRRRVSSQSERASGR